MKRSHLFWHGVLAIGLVGTACSSEGDSAGPHRGGGAGAANDTGGWAGTGGVAAAGAGGTGGGGESGGSGAAGAADAGDGRADAAGGCDRFASAPPSGGGELTGSTAGLIPLPRSLTPATGHFALSTGTPIVLMDPSSAEIQKVGAYLQSLLERATGYAIPLATQAEKACFADRASIELTLDPNVVESEGYHLEILTDRILLRSKTAAGLSRGVQTMRQLLPPQIESAVALAEARWLVPAVTIDDAPRFSYRGMHLDVSRHFFSPAFVKKYIDLIALYKLNTFHWHLTDDQGWRIEIKKYPKLTDVGAWRDEGGQRYGGFYTQEEVRDIVAYAAARFITIIPEIEMPGHALSALAAYPEYACTSGPFQVATTWGIFDDIYCPNEGTFAFLGDVLAEVFSLFPSPYVHLGGDEVRKTRWQASAVAQGVIKREGLADETALQGYFMRRMEKYAIDDGRMIIGWDEILETGVTPSAAIMVWHGGNRGATAATQGHDVIMTPNSNYYFDYYQADPATEPQAQSWNRAAGPRVIRLQDVYALDPMPTGLDLKAAAHVLGGQGSLWTEYIPTPEHAEYMAFPRAVALAEALWSQQSARDYAAFVTRLSANVAHLDAMGVKYAKHF